MTELLDTLEVARFLGIHPQTLAAWRSQGRGPKWVKVGARVVRYRPGDIEKWLRRNEQTTTRAGQ